MKISEILEGNRQFISLEVVPPQRSIGRAELLDSIRPLMEFNPPYINVTNHRDEYVFEQQPDGSFLRKLERRRVSQTAVCASIMDEFKIEVVPHLICAGATKEQVQYELSDFRYLGVENVMALRGDCLVQEKRFTPEPGGYSYASELVADIKDDGLCRGVGAYPESMSKPRISKPTSLCSSAKWTPELISSLPRCSSTTPVSTVSWNSPARRESPSLSSRESSRFPP